MFTEDELHQARATDLRATAERLGSKLKKIATSELAGNCPHCGGIDRFSINIKKNIWHCRGCGTGGDVIKLEMHVNGRSFPEAVEALIGKTSDGKRRQPTAEEITQRAGRRKGRTAPSRGRRAGAQ